MNLRTILPTLTLLAVTAVGLLTLASAPVQATEEATLELAGRGPKYAPGKPLRPVR